MITHLVDSDWLADYLKGKDQALNFLRPLIEKASLATSVIAYGEIYEGLLGSPTHEAYLIGLADLIAGVPLLGLDEEIAELFAGQRNTLRAQGQLIPDHDIWIAATALRYELTLVTRDKHFERIPNLKLYKPD